METIGHMASDPVIDVLHIASFQGNVGDNANHNGTRNQLERNTSFDYSYNEEEIRKYYQNYTKSDALAFDRSFVDRANEHDLVIIGSGNFFELWIESSSTGTTIDMEVDRVDELEVPIIFYGLGCDPYKGIPGKNREKFRRFLDTILEADHCFVSVRNDGSITHIEEVFGNYYTERVHKVPDGGFFTSVDNHWHPEISEEKITIAVNVAKDMADLRFPDTGQEAHTYESFMDEFAEYLDELLLSNPEYEVVFLPHIYSDLEAISDLLGRIENMNRRSRVTTAPYLHGEGAEKYIFDTYRKADLAMGMRFHTNVCSIGQNTPTIGLVSYPKVGDLYEIELSMPDRTVDLKEKGFTTPLSELTMNSIKNQKSLEQQYASVYDSLEDSMEREHTQIDKFLKSNL